MTRTTQSSDPASSLIDRSAFEDSSLTLFARLRAHAHAAHAHTAVPAMLLEAPPTTIAQMCEAGNDEPASEHPAVRYAA